MHQKTSILPSVCVDSRSGKVVSKQPAPWKRPFRQTPARCGAFPLRSIPVPCAVRGFVVRCPASFFRYFIRHSDGDAPIPPPMHCSPINGASIVVKHAVNGKDSRFARRSRQCFAAKRFRMSNTDNDIKATTRHVSPRRAARPCLCRRLLQARARFPIRPESHACVRQWPA